MKFSLFTLLRLAFVGCAYFLFVSCSKDADLLSDYVVTDTDDISQTYALLVNDTYFLDMNTSVVLDVLSNDNVTNLENVTIVETSTPTFGSVVINEDNTLTYTPPIPVANESETVTVANESETVTVETETATTETETATTETETITTEEEVVDTFVYITEETSEEGEVTTAEATVTVTMSNIESKYPTTGPNIFYVSTSGVSTNNGKTESTAWDITHSFKTAKAGDIIHIKAGNYGNKNLIVANSGTSSNPIKFIGYSNQPGDVVSNQGSTFSYGESVDASKMPLIQGNRTNNEGKGEGIVISNSFIHIANFQIKYFEKGLLSMGDNNVIDNIIVTDVGDFNPANSAENAGNAFVNYNGVGIVLRGNDVIFKNSTVVNAGAEGIHVKNGTNQIHSYNSVYSDNTINPCDYYYLFSSSSNNNTIDNAFVYRKSSLSHKGHGLACKGDAEGNIFTSFEIVNTVLEISMADATNNLFENGVIQGSYKREERWKNTAGGILIANGAHHNILKNIKISKVEAVISFNDWNGENSYQNSNDAGNNNSFINIEGEDSEIAINFDEFMKLEGAAHNNIFENCKFKDLPRLFHVNRPNSNNKFENCTFENIDKFQLTSTSAGFNYIVNSNTVFNNTTTVNLGFSLP